MKKSNLLILTCALPILIMAQQNPTGTANTTLPPSQSNSSFSWFRGGNFPGGSAGINNIFGTMWNSPIYTVTNGENRTKLNGTISYTINGFTGQQKNGALLIADGQFPINGGFYTTGFGAYSLLHISGNNGTFVQQEGYRPWMHAGMTITDNQDLSYFGLRRVGNGDDITETVIAWSDNVASSFPGPDDLTFRFLSQGPSNGGFAGINTANLIASNDLDGLHIARFAPNGNFGLGNTFGINTPGVGIYVRPQSLAHYSLSDARNVWQQFTNRIAGVGTGTGENATDGLRVGIMGNINDLQNGNALIYNQEQRHLLFSTNVATDNSSAFNTFERMRITSIGAPTVLSTGGYGIYNPGGFGNTNLTRVAISHNPSDPITRPLSLLHLGYNTGFPLLSATNTDGWRNWMNVGTFISAGTDNLYLGLKNEQAGSGPTGLSDRMDAVLNWGDNPSASSTGGNGPDNLRIIFTSSTTGTNPSPANSQDGLEVARFFPGTDTTYTYLTSIPSYTTSNTNYISHGRMGVGDFTNQGINENTPKQKLDVIGNARLRFLPDNLFKADSLVNKYVMVDSLGVLRWADANLSSGFGSNCSDSINSKFTTHRHVDLNQFNFYFKGKGGIPNYNSVGIGYNCGENLIAKFNVRQKDTLTVSVNTTAGYFLNNDITNSLSRTYIGVQGVANGNHPLNLRSTNIGGDFIADSADVNYGVRGIARSGLTSTGGYFDANGNSNTNFGIRAYASNGTISNVGVYTSIQATAPIFNYGVFGQIQGTNSAVNRAGYFNGDLEYTQGLIGSDQMFKTNVDTLSNALDIIRNVMPKTYLFDTAQYSQFNFSARPQYGFIAQEVEQVLPELVHQSYHPGVLDSSNTNYIVQPTNYKSLNYNAFIPINTQAIKELDAQINRVRSEIDTLNTRNDSIRIIRDRETLSDQQLKTNVQTLSGSLNKVRQMRGITYNWNHSANPNLNLDSLTHIGFVAQEVNTVEPLLTFIDDSSYMHVNYQRFVPVLLQSIKELDNQVQQKDSIIQSLDSRLTQLEQLITQCCNAAQNRVNNNSQNEAIAMLEVTLSSKNVVVLNQNVPNPFAEQTSISFQIPEDVKYAQMIFTDNLGKIIKTMDIEQRGKGVITVFADDLSTGIYTYTLVIDGKAIDSKRMIKK